jgi:hypothetical protein
MASGAYTPMFAASPAGNTNIVAPTTTLTVLAASPHVPTARTRPASRSLDIICDTVARMNERARRETRLAIIRRRLIRQRAD